MTNSRAMKVAFALATCSTVAGFVPRVPLGKSFAVPQGRSPLSMVSIPEIPEIPSIGSIVVDRLKDKLEEFVADKKESDAPCLPQDSSDPAARNDELVAKQAEYQWIGNNGSIFANTPFLKANPVPEAEKPKLTWVVGVLEAGVDIVTGLLKGVIKTTLMLGAIESPETAVELQDKMAEEIRAAFKETRAVEMTDYNRLHSPPIDTPKSVYDFNDDDVFARNRLQGGNCITIEKCSLATYNKIKSSLEAGDQDFKKTVDDLLLAEKLFVVDQELLAGMESQAIDGLERFLAPCIALFEYDEENEDLMPIKPIGIQMDQGAMASSIYTPADSADGDTTWEIAKLCFEASDFIIHEIVSHLTYTHLVLEGPMVAMNRQLSVDHPINTLLRPHLEGTAFINLEAQEILIDEGGIVDNLQANYIADSWGLCVQEWKKRISSDFSPEFDFAARGMDTSSFKGRYMYRDVGTAYWSAIHTWVTEYLEIYYDGSDAMENDPELQAFITDLSSTIEEADENNVGETSTTGGQMAWLKDYDTAFDKRAFIAKVIATLIYTASTLHAAVNFPQADTMSYTPACPGAMYAAPPTDVDPLNKISRSEADMMAYMPPMYLAASQVNTMTLLGSVHHTRLGHYPPLHFRNIQARRALEKFMTSIEDIGADLTVTNAKIVSKWSEKGKTDHEATNFAYTTLMPDLIPQSINI